MKETIEERVDRLIQEVLNTYVDLFGSLMAEHGVAPEDQRDRLEALVRALQSPSLEKTIFEGGRRLPTDVDSSTNPPRIRLNTELLSRVDDEEILSALARPISEVLELTPLSVSLAFEAREERHVRNLTTKAQRKLDTPVVRATEVPAYVAYKTGLFTDRIGRLLESLGKSVPVEATGLEQLREALSSHPGWPEWIDVRKLEFAQSALGSARASLDGSPYEGLVETLTELVWDSLGLSTQSFLRHSGRMLRAENLENFEEVLVALARCVGVRDLSMANWPAYTELTGTWAKLVSREQAVFGNSPRVSVPSTISVVEPARKNFGLDEPKELPWDLPLLCWTVREQSALRDLLLGLIQTLPGVDDEAFSAMGDLRVADEPQLETNDEPHSMGIQVVSISSDIVAPDQNVMRRAWSAALHQILTRFDSLELPQREGAVQQLRVAYDELFPEAAPVWERRFYGLDGMESRRAFHRLVTEIHELLQTPVLLDPFTSPTEPDLSPYPTLAFIVGVSSLEDRVPFWLPLSALVSTTSGVPLRVRVVNVPMESSASCQWLCDRKLNLQKLQQQPAELLMRSIRGDALQMAVFE